MDLEGRITWFVAEVLAVTVVVRLAPPVLTALLVVRLVVLLEEVCLLAVKGRA